MPSQCEFLAVVIAIARVHRAEKNEPSQLGALPSKRLGALHAGRNVQSMPSDSFALLLCVDVLLFCMQYVHIRTGRAPALCELGQ